MLAALEQLESAALSDLSVTADAAALESWRITYLGTKGKLKAAMGGLKDVIATEKPKVGQRLNALRAKLEENYQTRVVQISGSSRGSSHVSGHLTDASANEPMVDLTEPGLISASAVGRRHIITRVRDELVEVFARMGFSVAQGPELEDDEHNFIKLNIPPGHPAREPSDNFYVDDPLTTERPRMLRSQTSTVQVRVMEDSVAKGWGPPIKIVSPGRVYRPDTVDATHSFMFHQIEGLYLDRAVSMVDLKTTLFQFARAYFGPSAEVRLRPSFFPFTEPSAEFDMKIALRPGEPPRWIELGGCGMVDPAVLQLCGIDPEAWTGFAFGFGIERLAIGKYGIPDIRLLFENDARFLAQL